MEYQITSGSKTICLTKKDINFQLIYQKENLLKISQNNKNYTIEVVQIEDDLAILRVNERQLEYKINTPLDGLIEKMGFNDQLSKNVESIIAPMPGLILDILVEAEDEVTEGQTILILEAMKMENVISIPIDGKIKEVLVHKGAAVEKNQVLVELH